MYNAQTVRDRIEIRRKEKGISNLEIMLKELNIGKSTVWAMTDNKGIGCFALAKIADRLDCSTDYLLGRTNNPNVAADTYINGNNNGVQAISNGHHSSLTVNGTNSKDKDTDELVDLVQSLPLIKKAEAIIYLNKLKKES